MALAAPSDGSGGHGSCSGSAPGPGMDGFTGASQGATAAASPSATQASAVRERFMYTGDIYSVWSHGIRIGTQGFKCLYCGREYNGGAATRFAEHLASLGKQVRPCDRVPREVRAAIRKMRLEKQEKRREDEERDIRFERELVQEMHGHDITDIGDVPDDLEVRTPLTVERSLRDLELRHEAERRPGTFEHGFGSGSSNTTRGGGHIERHLRKRSSASSGSCGSISGIGRGKVTSQQRIDVAMDKTKIAKIGEAWARWFHANEIPGRKANCYYFRAALRLSMEIGLVLPLPNGSDIDGKYLDASCMEMEDYICKFKTDWDQFGVTVMCDSWTGPTSMSIINFMVYCNERMFFHKSINATGKIQNADFLYGEIKKVVVEEIGHKVVVQIVTDNGSNYKKACENLIVEYPHIFWQPCAAHTINLMLKDIGQFPEVDKVVKSAKRICKFFYSHNRLHDEMRKKIGGELIRPNATRFGTVFIFLQSFHDRKDKFREWMVSLEWRESDWRSDPDYDFIENNLTSSQWWAELKWILDTVEPLYTLLRYADQQKNGTVSGFQSRMMLALHSMEAHLGLGTEEFRRYMSKVAPRVRYLYTDTLMLAASVIHPEGHYKLNSSDKVDAVEHLTKVISQIADSPKEASEAMAQFLDFRANKGRFDGSMARLAASSVSPSAWWLLYGGEVKTLQKYALRIVSQCVSSSGCERNWSTFALIHTKVRNRLSYEKLHKLVYVHYNLKLRIQQHEIEREERELDPISMVMDATFFDEKNPIMEWLNNSRSESSPILDEEGMPSRVVVEEIHRENLKRKLARIGRKGRRKTKKLSVLARNTSLKKVKKVVLTRDDEDEDEFVESDDSDDEDDIELEDNSSDEDDDDGDQEEENTDEEEMRVVEEDKNGQEEKDGEERDATERRRLSKRGNKPNKDPNSLYY